MDAINVDGLKKSYAKGPDALDGVSFQVRPGEIFGLLGPNGAGKSTTVRILVTLTAPSGGRALVAGHDVVEEPAAVRASIGYVGQSMGANKHATARENLELHAQLGRVPSRLIRERVSRMLAWTGLEKVADKLVSGYSGGMKRRLDIAMGLVHEPRVLFLDEPTTGLDPEARLGLWRDLAQLKRESNMAVLLTTHYLEEADQLCDRVAIMDRGKVVVEGEPAALKAQIRGDVVTLEIDSHGAVERALELLRVTDEVLEVKPLGSAVTAQVARGASAVPVLITTLERAGVRVGAATLSRPSLDDVYMHHTGRRFASGNGAPSATTGGH
jgi:ABC-2 type transport system ATP-binding protein